MFLGILLLLSLVFPLAQTDRNSAVVNAADGVPIQYSVQGKGDTALVFVHCWACDRTYWDNQVSEFAKNYRVVTIDLPGHGQSGQGRKSWSIPSFAEDVKTVVTKLDLKRVVLIGSSMGGPISLEAARVMPDRVVAVDAARDRLRVAPLLAGADLFLLPTERESFGLSALEALYDRYGSLVFSVGLRVLLDRQLLLQLRLQLQRGGLQLRMRPRRGRLRHGDRRRPVSDKDRR